MTCFKKTVTATIVAADGQRYLGTNYCLTPQDHCPRGDLPSGVGYELCKSVCQQVGHAEIVALDQTEGFLFGATCYVEGHTYCCPDCESQLWARGCESIVIGPPPCR